MSGHSKWSTIKRKKGATDAKRGKIFSRLIKEITLAARTGGGDLSGNHRLRRAVDTAKGQNMPADNIDRAIKKGTGELEGVAYEELVYEGVGAGGALFVVEITTDNRNRTAAEIRKVFEKGNGQLGGSGSSAWAFEHKGIIKLPKDAMSEDALFEIAVGAGAENLEADDESWVISTARNELDAVTKGLSDAGVNVAEATLAYIPNTPKEVSGKVANQLVALFELLDDHDDVQCVYADFELSDQALAELEE